MACDVKILTLLCCVVSSWPIVTYRVLCNEILKYRCVLFLLLLGGSNSKKRVIKVCDVRDI